MAVDSIDTTGTSVLTAGATEYADAPISLAWIMAGALLLTPMGAFAFSNRTPSVALLLGLGMLIGPSVLDLAAEETIIGMLKELRLGPTSSDYFLRRVAIDT